MSTRSIVSIQTGQYINHFYRHHDGMPYFGGRDLAVLMERSKRTGITGLQRELESAAYADRDGRLVYDEVGPRNDPFDLEHSDCDWLYEVTYPHVLNIQLASILVRVFKRGNSQPVFDGDGIDFLIWISDRIDEINSKIRFQSGEEAQQIPNLFDPRKATEDLQPTASFEWQSQA